MSGSSGTAGGKVTGQESGARAKGEYTEIEFVYFPPEVLNRMRPPSATEYPGREAVRSRNGIRGERTYQILGVV